MNTKKARIRSKLAAGGFVMFLVGIVILTTWLGPMLTRGSLSLTEVIWASAGAVVYIAIMIGLLTRADRSATAPLATED